MSRLPIGVLAALSIVAALATPAIAQTPASATEDDAVLKPAEPDFTLISLPTSLRLPAFKSAFRVTHRFTRPLSCDSCPNSVAADLFGIDSGAIIGLEYRFGIAPNGQIGFHRTSDKTIELFGQYGVARQSATTPVEASVVAAVGITNVGRSGSASQYAPSLGVIVARVIGDEAAFYLEPIWVHHTNLFDPKVSDNDTFMVGLGARVRVRPTVYLVGEFAPRVAGYKPGTHHGSVAIEKRAGGHMFQLNFSDSFATTRMPIARGGSSSSDWYMGFNITRKFY